MPLGLIASIDRGIAGSGRDGRTPLGLGWWGAVLLTLATLTTNFVNIYMSALAFKSLRPARVGQAGIWLIGGVGAALGLLSTRWLDGFATFTLLLAGLLVPDRRHPAGPLLRAA